MNSSNRRPAVQSWRCLALAAALLLPACARHAPPAAAPAPNPAAVRALQSDLSGVFEAALLDHALIAAEIRSLATGEVLYSRNATRLVMPASNMKILTMAASAERLGWDHQFETAFVSTAPVEGGILRGDLIIVGGGDPSINGRDDRITTALDTVAAQLKAAGILAIDGRVIGDDDAFEDEGLGPGWSWDYLAYGYATPVGALQVGENLVRVTVRPGSAPGAPAVVEMAPPESGLALVNRVVTGEKGAPASIDLYRLPGRPDLEVAGTIPMGDEPAMRTASADNPTLFFAQALRAGLVARGIAVRGAAVDIDDLGDTRPEHGGMRVLATIQSPPLSEIGTTLMKVSQNLYAETLLKTLGRGDHPGSTDRGRAVVREILESWGVRPGGYLQSDGSGLSRYNYVTAGAIVTILTHLWADPRHRDAFAATLPIAGRDGTLAGRMKGTRAEGNARAKTGSIANVRALSGYVSTQDGEPLVFSIVVNHFHLPAPVVDYAVDTAVETLANFTRK
jgi:D-alanyl-D-alanine carboxypeptidase/D-alanyl-D-alanine-endopeptidase (penicillin-binding protein 4)